MSSSKRCISLMNTSISFFTNWLGISGKQSFTSDTHYRIFRRVTKLLSSAFALVDNILRHS